MKNDFYEKNKGITLVVLVITIIILLILAGITISTIGGKNGLIAKVQEARKAQIEAEIIEKLKLAIEELKVEKAGKATLSDITQEWIDSKLPEYENTVTDDTSTNGKRITIQKDDVIKIFIIDENLNITEITTQGSIEFSYDIGERTGTIVNILIHIQDKVNGLSRIELPDTDAIIVESNKKEKKAIDYQVEIGIEYKFKIISESGETREEIILIQDFAGGKGTEENPYIIMTEEQLNKVRNYLNAHYKLGANIEITKDFEAIGTSGAENARFNGSLDGDGYKIIGLKNAGTTSQIQGLFGIIGTSGKVSNLTLENVEIKGGSSTGGLVGVNEGTISNIKISGKVYANVSSASGVGGLVGQNNQGIIENCYSSVEIERSANAISIRYVGGLVGNNNATINKAASSGRIIVNGCEYIGGLVGYNSGIISNAYSTGEVEGKNYLGGLIGKNYQGTITNTYTISSVKGGNNYRDYIGGLIGDNIGTVTNSYWTTEKSGVMTSSGGIGTTIGWLIAKNNLSDKFDFEEIWGIEDGKSLPYLNGMPIPEVVYVIEQGYITFESGNGTEENPYIIMTEEQLNKVRYDLNAHYKLGANIEITKDFEAIGTDNSNTRFKGSLDGDGYKIIGLKNAGTTSQYQGLFGCIGTSGKVSNLTLENVEIKGGYWTGGLVGLNEGTIQNVKISGKVYANVSSANYFGGLVGYNVGKIENCYSSAEIGTNATSIRFTGGLVGYNYGTINKVASSGRIIMNMSGCDNIGGLVGYNYDSGTISNAYTTGEVEGSSTLGGLIGCNVGTVTNTYTISSVKGIYSNIGGLIGYRGGTVTNSYWTTEKSGVSTSAGGTPLTLEQMQTQSSYVDWDFESGETWIMKTYPELIF